MPTVAQKTLDYARTIYSLAAPLQKGTPLSSPGLKDAGFSAAVTDNPGVWFNDSYPHSYDSGTGRFAIFNEDSATMPAGVSFKVIVETV
jgi:hypothetical protein